MIIVEFRGAMTIHINSTFSVLYEIFSIAGGLFAMLINLCVHVCVDGGDAKSQAHLIFMDFQCNLGMDLVTKLSIKCIHILFMRVHYCVVYV